MCIIFMLESHFQAQVSLSLKFYRLIWHSIYNLFPTNVAGSLICISVSVIPFFFLTYATLTCLCPLGMPLQTSLSDFVVLILIYSPCLLHSHASNGNHSLYFHGSSPPAALSVYHLSLSHVVDSCLWLSNEYTFNFTAHMYAPSSAFPLSLPYKL